MVKIYRAKRPDTSKLIELIYGSCTDPGQWRLLCEALRIRFDGAYVAMYGHDGVSGCSLGFLNTSYDEHFLQQYTSHYSKINPWAMRFLDLPVGVVHCSEEIVPFDDLIKTECYNDWIKPQENIATGAGVTLLRNRDQFFRLSCNLRLQDRDRHQPDVSRLLTTLTPHMQRALSLWRQFSGIPISSETEAALNLHPSAIFLLSADGKVIFLNQRAENVLTASRGIRIFPNEVLHFDDLKAQKHLDKAMIDLNSHENSFISAGDYFGINTSTDQLRGRISPFNVGSRQTYNFLNVALRERPLAMVIIDQDGTSSFSVEAMLRRDFHLTAAEVALASALMEGGSLRDFAMQNNKAVNTVKTQLKSIFVKLDVARQGELVSVISRLSQSRKL